MTQIWTRRAQQWSNPYQDKNWHRPRWCTQQNSCHSRRVQRCQRRYSCHSVSPRSDWHTLCTVYGPHSGRSQQRRSQPGRARRIQTSCTRNSRKGSLVGNEDLKIKLAENFTHLILHNQGLNIALFNLGSSLSNRPSSRCYKHFKKLLKNESKVFLHQNKRNMNKIIEICLFLM